MRTLIEQLEANKKALQEAIHPFCQEEAQQMNAQRDTELPVKNTLLHFKK